MKKKTRNINERIDRKKEVKMGESEEKNERNWKVRRIKKERKNKQLGRKKK